MPQEKPSPTVELNNPPATISPLAQLIRDIKQFTQADMNSVINSAESAELTAWENCLTALDDPDDEDEYIHPETISETVREIREKFEKLKASCVTKIEATIRPQDWTHNKPKKPNP